MGTILDQILANKRIEVAAGKAVRSAASLREAAAALPRPPDFLAALRSRPVGLIAEVKRRSPSAGPIREPFDPPAIAQAYERAGAQAVSVLMDERFFGGGEADFRAVRAAVAMPMLFKEFVVDAWQVAQAAALGASAVLLIAAALDDTELPALFSEVRKSGLTPLVEVHDEAEMRRAAALGAACIGINNRDLRTFVTSIDTTLRLAPLAPAGTLIVSESGIRTAADVARLAAGGIGAVLVGEHLLRRADLEGAVRDLMAG